MSSAYVAPADELEARIAAVWADVIGVERVGAADDYFALGGDSIRSLTVVSRLRKAGVPASVQDLHAHSTVARLAEALRGRVAVPSAPAELGAGPYPLSHAQAFVIDAYARENLQWSASGAFHLQDRLTIREPRGHAIDRLRRAIAHLVRRTPLLRTRIQRAGQRWLQLETDATPTVAVVDLVGQPSSRQDATIEALLREDRQRPFDPEHGAPIRFYAVVRSAGELELIVTAHHGFCDGWSLHSFYNHLFALYGADDAGARAIDHALARHEHGFRELVAREQAADHAAFWRAYARRLGPTTAPSADGYQPQRSAVLDREVFARASARAVASQTSLKAVLLEAFDAALARQLSRAPRVIATVTNARHDELVAPTEVFGLCWTFAPIVCAPGDRAARLATLHGDLLATEAHARHPVDAMFAGFAPTASFNYAHFHHARWQREGLSVTRGESFHRFHFPINLNVRRDDDQLLVTLSTSTHDRRLATELVASFTAELVSWG